MPSRTVDLTPEQDDFVSASISRGQYSDAGELLRAALDDMRSRWAEGWVDEGRLGIELGAGAASLECGNFTDVEEDGLDRYFDDLAAAPARTP